jgi:hypothetical protein
VVGAIREPAGEILEPVDRGFHLHASARWVACSIKPFGKELPCDGAVEAERRILRKRAPRSFDHFDGAPQVPVGLLPPAAAREDFASESICLPDDAPCIHRLRGGPLHAFGKPDRFLGRGERLVESAELLEEVP